MKKSVLIFSVLITIIGFTAFGLVENSDENKAENFSSKIDTSTTIVELSQFGINGGINIDIRTGKKTEFLGNKKKSDLVYIVKGGSGQNFQRPIDRQKLVKANSISDIIENYPENWIKDYNSVSISTIGENGTTESIGENAILTTEQKELLSSAHEIHITVSYKKANHNNTIQNREMNTSFVVIPEIQAEYNGGYDKMISYLKDNSLKEINAKNLIFPQSVISFIVNENGDIEHPELSQTSGDKSIDNMLVKMLKGMPQFTPAENAEGIKVKQKLTLSIGVDNC